MNGTYMFKLMMMWICVVMIIAAISSLFNEREQTYCPIHQVEPRNGHVFWSYTDANAAANAFANMEQAISNGTVHVIKNRDYEVLRYITNVVKQVHVEHFIDKQHGATLLIHKGEEMPSDRCWCGRKRRITELTGFYETTYDECIIHCDQCDRDVLIVH